jgi:hypothetical protein
MANSSLYRQRKTIPTEGFHIIKHPMIEEGTESEEGDVEEIKDI